MTTAIMTIAIENLKCGGCENTILKGLSAITGVSDVSVNHEQSQVTLNASPELRPVVLEKLLSMGYPEQGSIQGLSAGIATAKSFVSCAVGRIR